MTVNKVGTQLNHKQRLMEIIELPEKDYSDILKSTGGYMFDSYVSPSREFVLSLIYAGEYPHGDSHHYAEIKKVDDNSKIWAYKSGDKIRQISNYPWSPDSKTVYFGLIENGNKICKFDLDSHSFEIIYKNKKNENRLNWIHFIPQNFNGIVIDSHYWDSQRIESVEYILFNNKTKEFTNLTEILGPKIFPAQSSLPHCLTIFDAEKIFTYDVFKKVAVSEQELQLLKQGYWPKFRPYLIMGKLYLQLTNGTDNRYMCLVDEK